jgi:lysophospholipase L1-like esterase
MKNRWEKSGEGNSMSADVTFKNRGQPAAGFTATRRGVLIALGIGMTAPLFGCGGGGAGGAAASAPVSPPPSDPTPPPPPPPTLDVTPTVTFDSTATAGLTTNYAYLTGSSEINPAFSFTGAAQSLIKQLGTALPRSNMVSAAASNTDTFAPGTVFTTFYHTGTTLDVLQFGLSDNVMVYVNDTFVARYGFALVSGTAQSGGANTITLAAGSSAVSGYYNQYYVRIVGGTGVLNEVKQVTSYDGTSLTVTVDSAWTTAPDSTTQYVIQEGTQPFVLDASTGLVKYLHFKWNVSGQRKITIEQGIFAGVSADGPITPAPLAATTPLIAVGDSFWEGNAAPNNVPNLVDIFAAAMNWQTTNLGQGGTGFINPGGSRLNFQDRIAPPAEAWRISLAASAGTFALSVTLGASTSTTAPLAFNATQADIQTALNALSNVAAASGTFVVARGDFGVPLVVVGHGVAGATLSIDATQLTGGTASILGAYLGDVAENLPTDSGGNAQPFYLLVSGSGNDTFSTDAQVQTATTYVAQQIVARFPTAMPIFIGVLGDCSAASNLISAGDVSRNAAIAAGAALLPTINGKTPFIDTYAAGVGAPKIINGLGTVADPQAGTNSNLKSIVLPGHPTGAGAQFFANWLAPQVKSLLGTG